MRDQIETRIKLLKKFILLLSVSGGMQSFAQIEGEYPVAGTQPDRRPENAPVITTVDKGEEWYQQALTGLQPPYPESFKFLESQGNWHTPFDQPGMTGPYDLRGWHRASE